MSEQTHIINLPAGTDLSASSNLHRLLKLGYVSSSNTYGVSIANPGDTVIGTLERGNDAPAIGQSGAGMACAVNLGGKGGTTFLVVDDASQVAINIGDQLDLSTNGTVVKHAAGTVVGYAVEARGVGPGTTPQPTLGGLIRAVLF
jgi:hypothetical protein